MRVVIFTHSLVSDWNHGNAHFLRGVVGELLDRGADVQVYEPQDGWSRQNLLAEHGDDAIRSFEQRFPQMRSRLYEPHSLDLRAALGDADLVLVHEWNDPELVRRIGEDRKRGGRYTLLFHDTHHRSVTDPQSMAAYDLSGFDGVLAYGGVIRDIYLRNGWAANAWTWHEAADVRTFHPHPPARQGDVVWIGNWGDGERAEELREYLIQPVRALRLRATVYGVRYPESALRELTDAGIAYRGWLPNYRAPEVFAAHRVTIHVPRRPYTTALPGIPTIRPFEAMACGIPLLSSPWNDCEGLFQQGRDYLMARDGAEMTQLLEFVLEEPAFAAGMARRALSTIHRRHSCAHRVDELMAIHEQVQTRSLVQEVR